MTVSVCVFVCVCSKGKMRLVWSVCVRITSSLSRKYMLYSLIHFELQLPSVNRQFASFVSQEHRHVRRQN